jgi:hypothetical protein
MSRPVWARWVTRISLALGLIALALTIRDIGVADLAKYFKAIGWWWFAVVALEAVITSLDATAIRAFMSPESVGFRAALLSQLAGRSVNAVTPSGNLGEAVKISVLTEHVSQSRSIATILLYNIASFTVEFVFVSIAAVLAAALVPMHHWTRVILCCIGVASLLFSLGLYALVRRGMLTSVARLALRLHLLSRIRFERWEVKLRLVDDKLRLVAGARRRDRTAGIVAVVCSRATSYVLSLVVLHAIGEPITLAFVAGYVVGSHAIYLVSALVPLGLGISEGGYDWLFRALGEAPARGVTLVLARRVTLVVYAGIGLLLVTLSDTVQRARSAKPASSSSPPPSSGAPAPSATVLESVTLPVAPTVGVARISDATE